MKAIFPMTSHPGWDGYKMSKSWYLVVQTNIESPVLCQGRAGHKAFILERKNTLGKIKTPCPYLSKRPMPRGNSNGDLLSTSHFQHSGQRLRACFYRTKDDFSSWNFFSESRFMVTHRHYRSQLIQASFCVSAQGQAD